MIPFSLEFTSQHAAMDSRAKPRLLEDIDNLQSFWIQNFHYPLGLPRLSEVVIASIERGTRQAAAKLQLTVTGGLSFAWHHHYVYVSEYPQASSTSSKAQPAALRVVVQDFPQLWSDTCVQIGKTLTHLAQRIQNAPPTFSSLTPLWFEARDFCDRLWEQHFILMYASLISWCEHEQTLCELGILPSDPDPLPDTERRYEPDHSLPIGWPLCSAGADIMGSLRSASTPLPIYRTRDILPPQTNLTPLQSYRYSRSAAAASLTNFPSWSEAHTQWLDLSAAVPLKMTAERLIPLCIDAGLIKDYEDLFHFWPHEIETLLLSFDRPSFLNQGRSFQDTVQKRKDAYNRELKCPIQLGCFRQIPRDPIFCEIHGAKQFVAANKSPCGSASHRPEALRCYGETASPGTAVGILLEVKSWNDLKRLSPEKIVLCDSLLPEWAHSMGPIAGCLARRGGLLSHSATVCRERKIPGIVGIREDSLQLREGQRVRICGANGEVTILKSQEESNEIG